MKRLVPALATMVLACLSAASEPDMAALAAEPLLVHAVRYGDTETRRVNKARAREEVERRMPAFYAEILARLDIENVGLQVYAMELAMSHRSPEMTDLLAARLEEARDPVRKLAVYFLGFQDRRDDLVPTLRAKLTEDEACRGGAMRTLAEWGVTEAAPEMEPLLRDENERIRIAAANALRVLGQAGSAPALAAALDDEFFTVRHAAARALAAMGDAALPELENALNGSGVRKRTLIARILSDMGTDRASHLMEVHDLAPLGEGMDVDGRFFRK